MSNITDGWRSNQSSATDAGLQQSVAIENIRVLYYLLSPSVNSIASFHFLPGFPVRASAVRKVLEPTLAPELTAGRSPEVALISVDRAAHLRRSVKQRKCTDTKIITILRVKSSTHQVI